MHSNYFSEQKRSRNIQIASDIIPLEEVKSGLFACMKEVKATGHHLIITQNGRPAGVWLSHVEYDKLVYSQQVIESVAHGLAAAESGDVYCIEDVRKMLAEKRISEKL